MGLLINLLSKLAEIGDEVVSEQLKSDKARKDKINKNGKKSSVKTNIKRKNPTEYQTPIEADVNKSIEDIPIEERLRRYKETKRNAEVKTLQREKNNSLEFTNLEKKKNIKKYKKILKSRSGARNAFIYSTIFEKKGLL